MTPRLTLNDLDDRLESDCVLDSETFRRGAPAMLLPYLHYLGGRDLSCTVTTLPGHIHGVVGWPADPQMPRVAAFATVARMADVVPRRNGAVRNLPGQPVREDSALINPTGGDQAITDACRGSGPVPTLVWPSLSDSRPEAHLKRNDWSKHKVHIAADPDRQHTPVVTETP